MSGTANKRTSSGLAGTPAAEQPSPYLHWPAILDELRACGWRVACHNDYEKDGKQYTFWALTLKSAHSKYAAARAHPDGFYIKGEGPSDEVALRECWQKANGFIADKLALTNPDL